MRKPKRRFKRRSIKRYIPVAIILLVTFIVLLPAFIVFGLKTTGHNTLEEDISKLELTNDIVIKVYDHKKEKTIEMNLEEYLIGVLAAEMPASFELEALKSQAVAARTYALKRIQSNREKGNELHPGADICTDFNHAQAWIDKDQMKKNWGSLKYVLNYNKLADAIIATQSEILVYDGKLIDPVFHADCGGQHTENSENVWQKPAPYLKSVACLPRSDQEKSKSTVKVSLKEVDKALGTDLEAVPVARLTTNNQLLKVLQKTSSGRVGEVKLGDKILEGRKVREELKLKSTNFDLKLNGNNLEFTVIGYGHGVGLCQVGANELAKSEKNYKEILKHYYTDVKIVNLGKK